MYNKICTICSSKYEAEYPNQKTCCPECKAKLRKETVKRMNKNYRDKQITRSGKDG